eukprot:5185288-Prymnesium_polylepis.1
MANSSSLALVGGGIELLEGIQNLEAKLRAASSADHEPPLAQWVEPPLAQWVEPPLSHSALEEDAGLLRLRLETELAKRLRREASEREALSRRLVARERALHDAEEKIVELQHTIREREAAYAKQLEQAAAAAQEQQALVLRQAAERESQLRTAFAELDARLRAEVADAADGVRAAAEAASAARERAAAEQAEQRRSARETAERASRAMQAVRHAAEQVHLTLEVCANPQPQRHAQGPTRRRSVHARHARRGDTCLRRRAQERQLLTSSLHTARGEARAAMQREAEVCAQALDAMAAGERAAAELTWWRTSAGKAHVALREGLARGEMCTEAVLCALGAAEAEAQERWCAERSAAERARTEVAAAWRTAQAAEMRAEAAEAAAAESARRERAMEGEVEAARREVVRAEAAGRAAVRRILAEAWAEAAATSPPELDEEVTELRRATRDAEARQQLG